MSFLEIDYILPHRYRPELQLPGISISFNGHYWYFERIVKVSIFEHSNLLHTEYIKLYDLMGQESKTYNSMSIPFSHEMIKFTYWLPLYIFIYSFHFDHKRIQRMDVWTFWAPCPVIRTHIHRTSYDESRWELIPNICLPNCRCWEIPSVVERQVVGIHIYFWPNYISINRNGEIFKGI